MPSIVALDLETTGLNPGSDAITEIGAIRFNSRRIEEEFTTLVNPLRPIPEHVTNLTGITNQMVQNAPTIDEIIPELVNFVEDLPILGHNVKFDLAFLRTHGIFQYNEGLDTYDMASVLLPNAGRYKLSALGQILAIPFPATHRALDDAKVTQAVFNRLSEIALELPLETIAEIVRMGEHVPWGAEYIFKEALKARGKELSSASRSRPKKSGPLFTKPAPPPIEPTGLPETLIPLDVEEVASILDRGGLFSQYFPNFEHRHEQVELCREVASALSDGLHLLAEAGTGVGKSMAYLIPAAIWAFENKTRVIISTNTINLQDQLIKKDIPDVINVLDLPIKASVLKGKNNYLCLRRLEAMRQRGPDTPEQVRVLAKMLIWLNSTERGDLSEVNITGPAERAVWSMISANDEGCSTEMCVRRMGGICPFHRAKQAAQEAHILIVNHALLLADIATGNRVLPEYDYLIIDEGHHLEAATTSALSFKVTQPELERTLSELGSVNSGILGRMLGASREILHPDQYSALNELVQKTTDRSFQFQNFAKNFFISIDSFLKEQREGRDLGSYSQQVRILPATRTQPAWEEVEFTWEDSMHHLSELLVILEQVGQALSELSESGLDEIEDLISSINTLYRRLTEYKDNINALVFDPLPEQIYWAEISPRRNNVTLEAAPLHIGQLMEKYLWHEKTSVIVTSATLTTNGEFDYIRDRLNAFDADTLALGSPYDYQSSTLLFIPDDIPEPSDWRGHQKAIERGLISLCKATGGRTLALFTSYAQLTRTSNAISSALGEQGIVVFEQGQGASPHALLESFKSTDQAVLLGTKAFWEGVDVPGEALSVLAIIKLPFAVPSDPVVAARSETFDNPFYQYTIPEAILTFRQGFGRLIRSHEDHGVVAIFDRRVMTKQYGRMFIDSLPTCTVNTSHLRELPKIAADWLGI